MHFLYLIIFAFFISLGLGAISNGDLKERAWQGMKVFLQFVGVAFVLAWLFYFLPF